MGKFLQRTDIPNIDNVIIPHICHGEVRHHGDVDLFPAGFENRHDSGERESATLRHIAQIQVQIVFCLFDITEPKIFQVSGGVHIELSNHARDIAVGIELAKNIVVSHDQQDGPVIPQHRIPDGVMDNRA